MTKWIYILSQATEDDLKQIFDYSHSQFGLEQAIQYLAGLEQIFYQLCDNPTLGRDRTDIRDGLRAIPFQNHIVFYRVLNNQIVVVRVLHGSRDLPKFFSDL